MGDLPLKRHDPADGIPLQVIGYGAEEVQAMLDTLLSTWVTMGKRTQAFEAEWAAFCGAKHGVMVNSGSSANLVALSALVHSGRLQPGDEVLVPAVSWSTSLFPVAQCGLVPVMVDVDPDTLCVTPAIARAAMTPKTKGVIAVHLLGAVCDVPGLKELGLVVLEDACGAHGAEWRGQRVGAMGDVGTFSFFFSHHITTVEGGMIVMNDQALTDVARGLRAHGWPRERSDREAIAAKHPEIDQRFLFTLPGWNLRPTDVAAAMGRVQLKRLPAWNDQRRENQRRWCELLEDLPWIRTYPEQPDTRHAAFAFIIGVERGAPFSRHELSAFLESRKIVTRPVSGSNLARQPAAEHIPGLRLAGPLPTSDYIHEQALFIGNSQAFHQGHGELLKATLQEFINGHR